MGNNISNALTTDSKVRQSTNKNSNTNILSSNVGQKSNNVFEILQCKDEKSMIFVNGLARNLNIIPNSQCMQSRKDKLLHVSKTNEILEPTPQSLDEPSTKNKIGNYLAISKLKEITNPKMGITTTQAINPTSSTLHMDMHAKEDSQMADYSEHLATTKSTKNIIYSHIPSELSPMQTKKSIEIKNPRKVINPITNTNQINNPQEENAETSTHNRRRFRLVHIPNNHRIPPMANLPPMPSQLQNQSLFFTSPLQPQNYHPASWMEARILGHAITLNI